MMNEKGDGWRRPDVLWTAQDSNLEHAPYKSAALTIELAVPQSIYAFTVEVSCAERFVREAFRVSFALPIKNAFAISPV